MARIQMKNTAALKNFVDSKRRSVLRSFEDGEPNTEYDRQADRSTFRQQHNHLLSCLEQITVCKCFCCMRLSDVSK